jgi:arginyl-tRNA--protein-N-Asp/Glu arginylyltransferase
MMKNHFPKRQFSEMEWPYPFPKVKKLAWRVWCREIKSEWTTKICTYELRGDKEKNKKLKVNETMEHQSPKRQFSQKWKGPTPSER